MKTNLRFLMPLLASALGACGGSSSGDGKGQADTAIPAFDSPYASKIGQGYNSNIEAFTTQCATSNILHIGQRSAQIDLEKTVSSDKITDSLGFKASLKAKYAWLDASIATDVSSSVQEDDYSELFVYRAEYNLANDSFDENTFSLTPVGKAAQTNLTWQQVCGDQFVYQITNGARFYLVYRVEFASKTDKQTFDLSVGAKISSIVDLQTSLSKIDSNVKQRTMIEVRAYQFGGDPTKLSAVLSGTGKVDTDQNNVARAIVQCDLDHLSDCQQILVNAVSYNDVNRMDGLPAQINANPTNPTSYLLKPWTELALPSTPGILSTEIQQARAELSTKFDSIFAAKQRMLSLFNIPADQKAQLTTWQKTLEKDTLAINTAVVACYDNLKFDPNGKPLADLVQACVSAVDAIDATVPPDDLLDATGVWLIDGRAAKDGLILTGQPIEAGDGIYREDTKGGAIFWSPETDVHVLSAIFYGKLKQLGGPAGPLGFPTSDVTSDPSNGGQIVNFQNGIMIGRTDNSQCLNNAFIIGHLPKPQCFVVHEVHGAIFAKYAKFGGATSFLGYPLTDQTSASNGGQFNDFDNGSIYRAANSPEAFEVHGGIRDYYRNAGGPSSVYGYPASDETKGFDAGTYNDFQGGGIYWAPNIGTYGLTGAIWLKYIETRKDPSDDPSTGPQSPRFLTWRLGYPTANVETLAEGGLLANFQYGAILWSAQTGAHSVYGPMFTKYWSQHLVIVPAPNPRVATNLNGTPLPPSPPQDAVPPAGYPTADYDMARDSSGQALGWVTALQHGVVTYLDGAPDAYYIDGREYATYAGSNAYRGCLGFATSDQKPMYNAKEWVREFQHGELWVIPNDYGVPGNTDYFVQCK